MSPFESESKFGIGASERGVCFFVSILTVAAKRWKMLGAVSMPIFAREARKFLSRTCGLCIFIIDDCECSSANTL